MITPRNSRAFSLLLVALLSWGDGEGLRLKEFPSVPKMRAWGDEWVMSPPDFLIELVYAS